MKKFSLLFLNLLLVLLLHAEDGYSLWLRYKTVEDPQLLSHYRRAIKGIVVKGNAPTLAVAKEELLRGLQGLLNQKLGEQTAGPGIVYVRTAVSAPSGATLAAIKNLTGAGEDAYLIQSGKEGAAITITGNSDKGSLYGVFHFLRLLQTGQSLKDLSILSAPKIRHRILSHWDNLDRSVERGYAGGSIWDWHRLPDYIDPRYIDYARANASIGINGTVLTNVNANALVLTEPYLEKVAALANVFRPYGIKVYLTARFSAPTEIGGLKTADPLDTAVQGWWQRKTAAIYSLVPDFGGLLVKANSEGQPGPQNYGRNHSDGANMLADAVAPFGGIVMWRAFVYSNETSEDRFKQAYNEFKPLDGKFRKNVVVQVKNGPIDFQPREPFHPLFGAMPQTPLAMEFQLTQEYLGFATHLVYLPSMFKEVLNADTYAKGPGSTVAEVVDGTLEEHPLSAMAGVSNIGSDINWTGHPFGQANWYAYGRLAWDHNLSESKVAEEWLRQTFGNAPRLVAGVKKIMLASHEALVNYMTPLGLHHIMGYGHHYGPAPWWDKAPRADWNPTYFHRADKEGIGFDRTARGSNALAQYAPEVRKLYEDLATCPEEYLLWFHHLRWDYKMKSGKTLWEELCARYYAGVDSVRGMKKSWAALKPYVDKQRFEQVRMLLDIQEKEAVWWRNACLLYFQTFSGIPIPAKYEQPDKTLEYYKTLRFPYAPGNG